jgi:hypothetical protein
VSWIGTRDDESASCVCWLEDVSEEDDDVSSNDLERAPLPTTNPMLCGVKVVLPRFPDSFNADLNSKRSA